MTIMEKILGAFNRVASYVLICIAMVFSIFQLFSIMGESFQAIVRYLPAQGKAYLPDYVLKVVTLIFSVLLLVTITNTIRIFGQQYDLKMRTTIIVCMVGIARRLSLLQYGRESFREELAIVALVFALTMAYFLIRQKKPDGPTANLLRKWKLQK